MVFHMIMLVLSKVGKKSDKLWSYQTNLYLCVILGMYMNYDRYKKAMRLLAIQEP